MMRTTRGNTNSLVADDKAKHTLPWVLAVKQANTRKCVFPYVIVVLIYMQVILAVFPNDINGDIQMHNMGKLVHFCELTPQKLPKVASFLEKRVDSDLAKGRLGYVCFNCS
jgi:hypothetical protein